MRWACILPKRCNHNILWGIPVEILQQDTSPVLISLTQERCEAQPRPTLNHTFLTLSMYLASVWCQQPTIPAQLNQN